MEAYLVRSRDGQCAVEARLDGVENETFQLAIGEGKVFVDAGIAADGSASLCGGQRVCWPMRPVRVATVSAWLLPGA